MIFGIHGAFSTPRAFSYLKKSINYYEWDFLDYQNEISNIENIIDMGKNQISKYPNVHLIGHSMGGLIALHIGHDMPNVTGITTISAPLGGIELNLIMAYFIRNSFLLQIATGSSFMRTMNSLLFNKPVSHIISTKGFNPFMTQKSDGVVSIKSQMSNTKGPTKEIAANHSEILMCDETIQYLSERLHY